MKVIGVVGMPASGKGEFSRIAADRGIPVVVMGDMIRRAVREAGLPMTDENLGAVSAQMRARYGMAAVAHLTVPAVEESGAPVALIDGIRGGAEVAIFREHFPCFLLVGIRSDFDMRLERLGNRGRSDDSRSADDLRRRDERERGWGLAEAIEMADVFIENEGTMAEYAARVARLLDAVGGCP
ncbi:AAA family ATPase [Methanofollis fontis]|uniref:Dephospho-CoA kinase n=1 Tax=Methanofollis fontis TaxID=2052832 RepID=A0A483CR85_9EURY|nr:AAA family ATPase [Methanofollis fontis]TAJ44691.1 dephospho-CoA kinase [Methanofollis fontis]